MIIISGTNPSVETCKKLVEHEGCLLLKALPADFDYLHFLNKIGLLMPQYHGKITWDIKVNKHIADAKCSLGSVEVTPHTEYYEGESFPPNYLALWCVNPASCGGGKIAFADGYNFLSRLHPEERQYLYQAKYLYKSENGLMRLGINTSAYHCILTHSLSSKDVFRFNTTGMEDGDLNFLFSFRKKFLSFYQEKHFEFLQPKHSLLIWDNFRMVHGRSSSFLDINRHLIRVWIGETLETKIAASNVFC